MSSNYVDSIWDRKSDKVHVVERNSEGKRIYREYQPDYSFYVKEHNGKYTSIFNEPLCKVTTKSYKEFQKELGMHRSKRTYESDINPVNKCLEQNYLGIEPPKLNILYFDIEVDFSTELGFSSIEDPFNPITAISMYLGWLEQLITLVIAPEDLPKEEAQLICDKFENCILFESESEMLNTFLSLIDDADIITGWNSGGYDIPYTIQRITRILGKVETRRFCLWNQEPKKRMYEKFGKEHMTFDLVGRVHLDYMDLYRKFTYHEMHSYSLNAISEYELKERKVDYDGTLDDLYNYDFEKFIEYNRQDTMLIYKLDKKLDFIDLASSITHDSTVLIPAALGAVAVTEQAVINEAHSLRLIIPDRKESSKETKAVGAYVAKPKKGMHEWIGLCDINSLYPSAIRALNMSPETLVGQIRLDHTTQYVLEKMNAKKSFPEAWEGLFSVLEYEWVMNHDASRMLTIDWESGNSSEHSAKEIYEMIFHSNQKWILSANGTIFDYSKKGIVPGLLERWYAERKEIQARLDIATDEAEKAYLDKRQLVKKVVLNSAYGALLNQYCKFFDQRIGQSVTLSGRSITKHMNSCTNEIITGVYDYKGEAIIYSDTDSVFFSVWPTIKDLVASKEMEWDKDICIQLYDTIAKQVNDSFPDAMKKIFNCPRENGAIIKAGREMVATRGIYITKKRYAILYYDKDGKRADVGGKTGKVKAMGLDLKRSDTPEYMQTFLSEILKDVLDGGQKEQVIEKILNFKKQFAEKEVWETGRPMRANNLTKYTNKYNDGWKGMIPGHVMGCITWNKLREMNSDNYSAKLVDGSKVVCCRLKDNAMKYTCVSYPVDETRLPDWFKNLPFDADLMETRMIDKKVDNLLGILDWDLINATDVKTTFNSLFSWE